MNFLEDVETNKQIGYNLGEYCKICDNFLSETDFNTMKKLLYEACDGNIKWGHSSVGYHPYTHTHFSTDLTDIKFFNTYMFNIIEETFNKKLSILRIYSSLQNAYDYGNFHIDDTTEGTFTFTTYCDFSTNARKSDKDMFNDYYNIEISDYNTTNSSFSIDNYKQLYNVNKKYDNDKLDSICESFNKKNYNGSFEIKIPNTNFIHSVPYVPNRGVFFHSSLIHNGSCFNDNLKRIRCVVAFKLVTSENK